MRRVNEMTLNIKDYLNLSSLAYGDFSKNAKDVKIGDIIDNKLFSNNLKLSDPELSALQNSSNPLRSWKVIAQSPSSVSEVEFSIEINYTTISPLRRAYS